MQGLGFEGFGIRGYNSPLPSPKVHPPKVAAAHEDDVGLNKALKVFGARSQHRPTS